MIAIPTRRFGHGIAELHQLHSFTHDVNDGRKHLNFSDFSEMDAFDSTDVAEEIIEALEDGKMPLPPYLMLHPDARLSDSQVKALISWAKTLY